jgi:hypothetical protein
MLRSLLLTPLLVATTSLAWADSYWDHNGSLVRLKADGDSRRFVYAALRDVLVRAGVRPGTLLFSGAREGDRYYGTAFVFSRHCGAPLEYYVEGDVVSERRVVLSGTREVYTDGCRATGRRETDRLEFTYKYSD